MGSSRHLPSRPARSSSHATGTHGLPGPRPSYLDRTLLDPRFAQYQERQGTPQVIAQMRPFVTAGVDYFMLSCGGFPELTTLQLLRDEVLPALRAE